MTRKDTVAAVLGFVLVAVLATIAVVFATDDADDGDSLASRVEELEERVEELEEQLDGDLLLEARDRFDIDRVEDFLNADPERRALLQELRMRFLDDIGPLELGRDVFERDGLLRLLEEEGVFDEEQLEEFRDMFDMIAEALEELGR